MKLRVRRRAPENVLFDMKRCGSTVSPRKTIHIREGNEFYKTLCGLKIGRFWRDNWRSDQPNCLSCVRIATDGYHTAEFPFIYIDNLGNIDRRGIFGSDVQIDPADYGLPG